MNSMLQKLFESLETI